MAIEAVDTRARGLRPRREAEAIGVGGVVRRLDWLLLAALVAIVAYGLLAIDGITKHDVGGSAMSRQAMYAAVGAVLFIGTLFVDPGTYRRFWRPIYFGTLFVMVFVLAAGAATRGSHCAWSWPASSASPNSRLYASTLSRASDHGASWWARTRSSHNTGYRHRVQYLRSPRVPSMRRAARRHGLARPSMTPQLAKATCGAAHCGNVDCSSGWAWMRPCSSPKRARCGSRRCAWDRSGRFARASR